MIYALIGVIVLILFIIFLYYIHAKTDRHSSQVSKLYIDGKIIEIADNKLTSSAPFNLHAIGHMDELVNTLASGVEYPTIWENNKVLNALKNLFLINELHEYIRKEECSSRDITPYKIELRYGGYYKGYEEGYGVVHIYGDPVAVLKNCAPIVDTEEILRIAAKWKQQNLHCIAVATGDVEKHTKNVLVRGVREKMMFLGLVAIAS